MSVEVTPGATPETPQGTPQGATPNNPQPAVNPPATQGATPDTAAQIRDLETQLANANARIKELNKENKDHRLAAQMAEADRAELESYRAIGKPADITAEREAAQADREKAIRLERDAILRDELKLKPGALLNTLLGDRAVTAEGEGDARKIFVQDGDAKTEWDKFVEAHSEVAEALPALKAEPGNEGAARVAFPKQAHGDQKPAFDKAAATAAQAAFTKRALG